MGGGTHRLYPPPSNYCRNEGVSMAVSDADHSSSLESYRIPFSKYFRYSSAGGKFKHIYTELFFHMVSYTRRDVNRFAE